MTKDVNWLMVRGWRTGLNLTLDRVREKDMLLAYGCSDSFRRRSAEALNFPRLLNSTRIGLVQTDGSLTATR
jgi:hypothetical protein